MSHLRPAVRPRPAEDPAARRPPLKEESEVDPEVEVVSGLFCTSTEVTTQQFEYVGEGRGEYGQQPVYSYVGEGAGAFKEQPALSLRPCPCACAICFSLLVLAAIACAAYWVYSSNGGKEVLDSMGMDLDFSQCPPPDDCMATADECQLRLCCQNQGVGCPYDDSVVPKEGVGRLIGQLMGCETVCKYKGEQHTCADRIKFLSDSPELNQSSTRCALAQQQVASECSFCAPAFCTPAPASCG